MQPTTMRPSGWTVTGAPCGPTLIGWVTTPASPNVGSVVPSSSRRVIRRWSDWTVVSSRERSGSCRSAGRFRKPARTVTMPLVPNCGSMPAGVTAGMVTGGSVGRFAILFLP